MELQFKSIPFPANWIIIRIQCAPHIHCTLVWNKLYSRHILYNNILHHSNPHKLEFHSTSLDWNPLNPNMKDTLLNWVIYFPSNPGDKLPYTITIKGIICTLTVVRIICTITIEVIYDQAPLNWPIVSLNILIFQRSISDSPSHRGL